MTRVLVVDDHPMFRRGLIALLEAGGYDVVAEVITLFDDEASVRAVLDAGADGYIVKESSPEQIIAALDAVRMGTQWLGSSVPRPGGSTAAASPDPVVPGPSRRNRQWPNCSDAA
ncbi:hypothetical protein [Pseudonocardia abyssalis]|uniref:Response regulator transcription factor n=1 Tax=Pseudonocardia abyssalis TaxID=2792008 RepID=A0ABS6UZF3_9PSEU|nr:hypothetical protein [Pseudonocardia abyssalis]MBW0116728.1 response regulator transcription factor [Pseudonocardia abyssalis]MBW0137248.1 response regulator transcription factor [Pseudonocardia abyssalis]